MARTGLSLRERRTVEDMLHARMSVREIAPVIGRHCSTIYRDIERNGFVDAELRRPNGDYGVVAQKMAARRRRRRCKLVPLGGLRDAVIGKLKDGWSPEQIAGRLLIEGQPIRVSHETIHADVYGADGRSERLARYLPSRRRKRRAHHSRRPRGLVLPPHRSIHARPDHVETRATFGEREGDPMIFERAQGRADVASLVERKARSAVLFAPQRPRHDASDEPADGHDKAPAPTGPQVYHRRVAASSSGTEAWFCDPRAPCLKPLGGRDRSRT
ncbi:MAG: IS30 family transposase [Litorimonas sp.]